MRSIIFTEFKMMQLGNMNPQRPYCTQQRIVRSTFIYLSCTSCFPWIAISKLVYLCFCNNFCKSQCLKQISKKNKRFLKRVSKQKYCREYIKLTAKEVNTNYYILTTGTTCDNFNHFIFVLLSNVKTTSRHLIRVKRYLC